MKITNSDKINKQIISVLFALFFLNSNLFAQDQIVKYFKKCKNFQYPFQAELHHELKEESCKGDGFYYKVIYQYENRCYRMKSIAYYYKNKKTSSGVFQAFHDNQNNYLSGLSVHKVTYKYDAQNRLIQSDILDINDQPCLNLWNGSRYKYIYADADQIASDDFPFSFRYINDSRFNKKYLAKEIRYTLDENGAYIQRLHDNVNPFDNVLHFTKVRMSAEGNKYFLMWKERKSGIMSEALTFHYTGSCIDAYNKKLFNLHRGTLEEKIDYRGTYETTFKYDSYGFLVDQVFYDVQGDKVGPLARREREVEEAKNFDELEYQTRQFIKDTFDLRRANLSGVYYINQSYDQCFRLKKTEHFNTSNEITFGGWDTFSEEYKYGLNEAKITRFDEREKESSRKYVIDPNTGLIESIEVKKRVNKFKPEEIKLTYETKGSKIDKVNAVYDNKKMYSRGFSKNGRLKQKEAKGIVTEYELTSNKNNHKREYIEYKYKDGQLYINDEQAEVSKRASIKTTTSVLKKNPEEIIHRITTDFYELDDIPQDWSLYSPDRTEIHEKYYNQSGSLKKEIEEVFENGNPVNLYSSYDDDEFLFKYKKEFDYLERDSIFTEYFIRNNEVDTVVTNYLYAEQPYLYAHSVYKTTDGKSQEQSYILDHRGRKVRYLDPYSEDEHYTLKTFDLNNYLIKKETFSKNGYHVAKSDWDPVNMTKFYYSNSGDVEKEEYFNIHDFTGRDTTLRRIVVQKRDDQGNIIESSIQKEEYGIIEYQENWNGTFIESAEFDVNGNKIRKANYDQSKKPMEDRNGNHAYKYKYEINPYNSEYEQWVLRSTRTFDEQNRPKLHGQVHKTVFEYDSDGYVETSKKYFKNDGDEDLPENRALNENGVWMEYQHKDPNSANYDTLFYKGINGEYTVNKTAGFAKAIFEFEDVENKWNLDTLIKKYYHVNEGNKLELHYPGCKTDCQYYLESKFENKGDNKIITRLKKDSSGVLKSSDGYSAVRIKLKTGSDDYGDDNYTLEEIQFFDAKNKPTNVSSLKELYEFYEIYPRNIDVQKAFHEILFEPYGDGLVYVSLKDKKGKTVMFVRGIEKIEKKYLIIKSDGWDIETSYVNDKPID